MVSLPFFRSRRARRHPAPQASLTLRVVVPGTNPKRQRGAVAGQQLRLEELEPRQLLDSGLGQADGFIRGLYSDLLARVPQQAEVANWTAAALASVSREQIAYGFTSSAEYRSNLIRDNYRTLLGREAAPAEVAGWLRTMDAGLDEQQLTVQFLASQEYALKQGSNVGTWAVGLYRDVFGRTPDSAGFSDWLSKLQSGAPQGAVASAFVYSTEARVQLVTGAYQKLLKRDPDADGLGAWVAALGQGLTPSQMVARIAGSAEYSANHMGIKGSQSGGSGDPFVPTIHIDTSWLLQQAATPYLLDQANTVYVLETDVRVEGTAFMVKAANITLNLNDHQIVYGDSPPLTAVNGDFSLGSTSGDILGWDISKAPTAVRLPARVGMSGSMMLEVSNITSARTLVSSPVAIPKANRAYAAMVTPKGSWNARVQLSVVDTVTGQVLGKAPGDAGGGFAAVVPFTPGSTHPVRLQIDLDSTDGAPAYVDLDSAAVMAANDNGIFTYTSQGAANFTLKNGRVTQGRARGYASYPLNLNAVPGFTVDGVTAFTNGVDTNNLDATWASDGVVKNSVFTSESNRISMRMNDYAALKLAHFGGTLSVVGNRIADFPQAGIFVNSDGELKSTHIAGNDIRQRAVVTNGYGIYLYNVGANFEVADNHIVPVKGRGLMIEGWAVDGNVHGNYVEVSEEANLEYDAASLYAIALRMRNWDASQKNVRVHDNTLIARTGPGRVHAAMAAVLTSYNDAHQMDGANNVLENNVIKAIVETPDTWYSASALAISGIDAGTGWQFKNNTLESNDNSLVFGTDDSWEHADDDLSFTSNTVRRSDEGAARNYTGIRAGAWENEVVGVRLIDTRFENGATSQIEFIGSRHKDVSIGYLLALTVQDSAGAPAAGAAVSVYDKTSSQVFSGNADQNGQLIIALVTTVSRQTSSDPSNVAVEQRTPFVVKATRGQATATATLAMTGSMPLTLILA